MKEEEADVALFGVAINMDFKNQRIARKAQAPMKCELTTQEPINTLTAVKQVHTQPADEQQVGLPCFNHDACRHPAHGVKVPAVRANICLSPQGARTHGSRDSINAGNAVCQKQRWLRHANLSGVIILRHEQTSKD
jgi:hypothetical protein